MSDKKSSGNTETKEIKIVYAPLPKKDFPLEEHEFYREREDGSMEGSDNLGMCGLPSGRWAWTLEEAYQIRQRMIKEQIEKRKTTIKVLEKMLQQQLSEIRVIKYGDDAEHPLAHYFLLDRDEDDEPTLSVDVNKSS